MDSPDGGEVSLGFFSFVSSNYSRSSTLLNFKSIGIKKTYFQVPAKFLKSVRWIIRNRDSFKKLDVLVVMSPCHILTLAMKIVTKKPVVLDAGWSLTDGILSRGLKIQNLYKLPLIFAVDVISMHSADMVLVESMLQLKRVQKLFAVPLEKIKLSYTGLDESQFTENHNLSIEAINRISELREIIGQKPSSLVVLFRGKVNRESGFTSICEAAKILANEAIFIFVLGEHDLLPSDLKNVIRVSNLSPLEMLEIYRIANVAIGQISDHPRLKYTIPHKAYEAGYFKKSYVTARGGGVKEIYKEKSVYYLSEADSKSLARAILTLADKEIRDILEVEISTQYQNSLSQAIINREFIQLIRGIIN